MKAWTKSEKCLTEIILKVKKSDAPVDPAGQGNKSKEQVIESSMIDHLPLLHPYLFYSLLDWCREKQNGKTFLLIEREQTQSHTIQMIAVGDGGGVGSEDPTTQPRGHGHRPAEGPRAGAPDLIF